MKVSGGYVIHKSSLVREGIHQHTAALDRPVSDLDIEAVNAVQATAWRINGLILDVMREAWVDGVAVGGMEKAQTTPMPGRLPDGLWAAMAEDDKKAHTARLADIHRKNASAMGREMSLMDCIAVAEELRRYPEIYYPHSRCFRGRIHPIPCNGPQPQGNDISKSLLMFAAGLPLGPDGLFWLCVRAANCAGKDKLPLEERVQWVLDRQQQVFMAAVDPLGEGRGFWADPDVDEPWCLLATCYELATALDMANPEEFVSHLPIPLDGSCNGLQHLSAMGLDPIGARATNQCANTERQDIYEEVAKVVRVMVERDAAAGKPEAMAWLGKVSRKVVKRAVMTTPYGVTDQGIRTQLLKDGHVPDCEDTGPAANYLRDCLVAGLSETVQSARTIMAWLQTVANNLANAGIPFDWKTPTGSTVRQAYRALVRTQVTTLCGRLSLQDDTGDAPLNAKKCALAASPNFIHSFDAAHLSMTVTACHQRGIRSFAMIHDSYGTHAMNTTALSLVLREKFIEIYREDWLERTAEFVRSYAPHVELPPVPERGDFDLSQVIDAPFFFS